MAGCGHCVRLAAGVLLMAAAGLKLAGWHSAALVADNPLDAAWVRLGAIEWELLLGVWLVSNVHQRAAWLFGLLTFILFAAISTYLGLAGHASCNCFGVVATNPWGMVALDVLVIVALILTRPAGVASLLTVRAAIIAVAAGLFAFILFGTPLGETAQDRVRGALFGSHVTVAGQQIDFGGHAPGEIVTIPVEVRNAGREAVAVVGGTNDCSCHVMGTPRVVPAYGTATIEVGLKIPERAPGRYARQVELWTDATAQPRVRLAGVYEVP